MAAYNNNDDVGYQYKLFFHDCIWEDNRIIYPASNCSAICQTDMTTGETKVIGTVDEEKETMLFYGAYKWKEYLILPSRNARTALSLFNMKTNEWSYIIIDETKKNWLNFREENVFEMNGYFYIFSFSLVVLKVDMEKKSVDYLFYPDIEPDDDRRGEITYIDNTVFIPVKHDNKIYKFDLNTEQWEVIEVNTELKGIDTLCFDGRLFWLTGIGQMICSWNEKDNTSICYKNFPHKFKKLVDRSGEEGFWFNSSIAYDNSIYFIPCDANMIIEFDIKNGKANEFFIEDEWEEEEDTRIGRFSTIKYMGAKKKDNMLMMLSNKNKNLILIDLQTKKISKVELNLNIENGVDKIISGKQILLEGTVKLNAWLNCVNISRHQCDKGNQFQIEAIGTKIYCKS